MVMTCFIVISSYLKIHLLWYLAEVHNCLLAAKLISSPEWAHLHVEREIVFFVGHTTQEIAEGGRNFSIPSQSLTSCCSLETNIGKQGGKYIASTSYTAASGHSQIIPIHFTGFPLFTVLKYVSRMLHLGPLRVTNLTREKLERV